MSSRIDDEDEETGKPTRIDEQTVVPLKLVLTLFSAGITMAAAGTIWVVTVNNRLSRIEDKLGISRYTTDKTSLWQVFVSQGLKPLEEPTP